MRIILGEGGISKKWDRFLTLGSILTCVASVLRAFSSAFRNFCCRFQLVASRYDVPVNRIPINTLQK